MAKIQFGKWLGGGLGWALGGPLGGVLGFALGSAFDAASVTLKDGGRGTYISGGAPQVGDFAASLLVLSAAVMKSDGKILKSELDYVKNFLAQQFGEEHAQQQLLMLKEILKQEIPLHEVCIQIKQYMPHSQRLQIIHYLFGISKADLKYIYSRNDDLETVSYQDARSLILCAVDFAKAIGIAPHSSWNGIPSSFIESHLAYKKKFSFGQDGKPYYFSGPHDYELYNVEEIISKVSEANGHCTVHI